MKLLNRRRFLGGAVALAPLATTSMRALLAEGAGSPHAGSTVFVGTQTVDGSQGIYAFHWDGATGTLTPRGLAAATPMPTYLDLSPDRRLLYSCNETESFTIDGKTEKSGGVSSFRIQPGAHGAELVHVESQFSGGTGTTNITVDHTGQVLLCANYTGGSCSSFQLRGEGQISPVVSHFQYHGHGPNPTRQESPHVHRATVSPGNGYALFNDLGLDLIHIYRLDAATARLEPHTPAAWHAPAGSGPRSLRFHPNGKWAYCVTEMGSSVLLLDWDEVKGTLTTRQSVSLVPKGFTSRSQAAETAISHDGRFLYASDRYYDNFYGFRIDPKTGELQQIERVANQGKTARYITLDPTGHWLLAANQDSNNISILARDPETGLLAQTGKLVPQTVPQFIQFLT